MGIGPEVSCRALAQLSPTRPVVLLGDADAIKVAAASAGLAVESVTRPWSAGGVTVFEPSGDEPVEVLAIRSATSELLAGRGAALVTGPIHKGRLSSRGFAFKGHTDFLGHLCGVDDPVMAFVGGRLKVALVTVHMPLAAVPAAVTTEAVLHTIRAADDALRLQLGLQRRRLLIAGLNPHAGDGGVLGTEDITQITPAVEIARAEGRDARGPMSIETAVRQALADDGDLIVAMYHDQGLAPLKAVDFGRSVNWTLGLPIIRTSVDHGTADDLVGTGKADPASMVAALQLALDLI